jgi:cytochrome oxidase Cu insertion factor (SCO1/SenC/PrrC family)
MTSGMVLRGFVALGCLTLALALPCAPVHAGTVSEAPNPFDRTAHPLGVGDMLPDAPYVDQAGNRVHLHDFRGRTLIIGFIYTNCADQCPLLTAKFGALAAQLPPHRFALLEISIDPERDTQAAIANFAHAHEVRSDDWRVLTGSPAAFDAVAVPLGISVVKDPNGELLHSERTIIVGPDGRIAYVIDTAAWTPGQVLAVARHVDGLPSSAVARLDLDLAKAVQAVCGGVRPGRSGLRDVVGVAAVFTLFALLAGFAAWRIFGRSA